jgi:hypothetical protein
VHNELEAWLDEVWQRRHEIIAASAKSGFPRGRGAAMGKDTGYGLEKYRYRNLGINLVYQIYGRSEGGEGEPPDIKAATADMVSQLSSLETEIKTGAEVQCGAGWFYTQPGTIRQAWRRGRAPAQIVDEAKRALVDGELSRGLLYRGFFHFRKKSGNTAFRLYGNLKPAARGRAFRQLVREAWSIGGLTNAKLAGPDDGGRADSFLFYTETTDARDAIVEIIRAYQARSTAEFAASLPKLVEPVNDLVGVGLADEPESLQIVSSGGRYYQQRSPQSFGSYRAALIFMALDRTAWPKPPQSDEQRQAAFKRRAARYFRAAGIDPDRPALQGAVDTSGMLGWDALRTRIGVDKDD